MNVRIGEEREEIQEQRLIERPMYDKISKFSRKTEGKITINTQTLGIRRTINRVLKKIPFNKQSNIKVDGLTYPLNQMNREKLENYVVDEEEDMAISESDKIFFNTLKQADSIEVSYVERNNNLTNPSAAFFNYLNKTEFNLERYGVYKEVNPDNYIHNCLYIALQNGGLSDVKLNLMKSFVINREVAMCKLKDICEKFNFGGDPPLLQAEYFFINNF